MVKVLDGVDFCVKHQEFIAIIGKSTLLHMIVNEYIYAFPIISLYYDSFIRLFTDEIMILMLQF